MSFRGIAKILQLSMFFWQPLSQICQDISNLLSNLLMGVRVVGNQTICRFFYRAIGDICNPLQIRQVFGFFYKLYLCICQML
jgi:hypothetical protein